MPAKLFLLSESLLVYREIEEHCRVLNFTLISSQPQSIEQFDQLNYAVLFVRTLSFFESLQPFIKEAQKRNIKVLVFIPESLAALIQLPLTHTLGIIYYPILLGTDSILVDKEELISKSTFDFVYPKDIGSLFPKALFSMSLYGTESKLVVQPVSRIYIETLLRKSGISLQGDSPFTTNLLDPELPRDSSHPNLKLHELRVSRPENVQVDDIIRLFQPSVRDVDLPEDETIKKDIEEKVVVSKETSLPTTTGDETLIADPSRYDKDNVEDDARAHEKKKIRMRRFVQIIGKIFVGYVLLYLLFFMSVVGSFGVARISESLSRDNIANGKAFYNLLESITGVQKTIVRIVSFVPIVSYPYIRLSGTIDDLHYYAEGNTILISSIFELADFLQQKNNTGSIVSEVLRAKELLAYAFHHDTTLLKYISAPYFKDLIIGKPGESDDRLKVVHVLSKLMASQSKMRALIVVQDQEIPTPMGGVIVGVYEVELEEGKLSVIDHILPVGDQSIEGSISAPLPILAFKQVDNLTLELANWSPDTEESAESITRLYQASRDQKIQNVFFIDKDTLELGGETLGFSDVTHEEILRGLSTKLEESTNDVVLKFILSVFSSRTPFRMHYVGEEVLIVGPHTNSYVCDEQCSTDFAMYARMGRGEDREKEEILLSLSKEEAVVKKEMKIKRIMKNTGSEYFWLLLPKDSSIAPFSLQTNGETKTIVGDRFEHKNGVGIGTMLVYKAGQELDLTIGWENSFKGEGYTFVFAPEAGSESSSVTFETGEGLRDAAFLPDLTTGEPHAYNTPLPGTITVLGE